MTNLALIGMEGAGKTVFTACLVKFIQRMGEGYALDPQSTRAQHYVDHAWRTLRSGEWPGSTRQKQLPILEWILHLPGRAPIPFRLIDPPGHDIRQLFSEDASLAHVSPELQELASHVIHADLVLLLINLADFLGDSNPERKLVSELGVKFVLDALARRRPPPRVLLLLTQVDQYPGIMKKHSDPWGVLQQHLPLACQAASQVPAYVEGGLVAWWVSSVNHTQPIVDAQGARRVPVPGFQSLGFEEVVQWIQAAATQPPPPLGMTWDQVKAGWDKAKVWLIPASVVLYCAILMGGCLWQSLKRFGSRPPRPNIVTSQARYVSTGFLDYDVIVTGQVRNEGTAGNVTVYAGLNCGSQHWDERQTKFLAAGATSDYDIRFSAYATGKASYSVSTTPEALGKLSSYRTIPE